MKRSRPFLKIDRDARDCSARFRKLFEGARVARACRHGSSLPRSLKISFQNELKHEVPISFVEQKKRGGLWMPGFLCLMLAGTLVLVGCSFAPRYKRPLTPAPNAFKELTPETAKQLDGWKTAEPSDAAIKGKWWEVFNDPKLNALEDQVDISNQTVAAALANFLSARAVVKQNRSQFFPTATADPSVTRQRQPLLRSSVGGVSAQNNHASTFTEYLLPLDASWEPDFWGRVRNTVRASRYEAQATLADLENTRLTVQSEVAIDYLQVRSLDAQEKLLTDAVDAYRESWRLTKVRHDTGIASDQDVAQAEIQLNSTAAQATDIGIQRAQFEHAVAVLIGKAPAEFSIPPSPLDTKPVAVPFGVPSNLLERRPDISAAERRVAEANAQIGVARAAYFPNITLSASAGYQSSSTANLFTGPAFLWSVGAAGVQTIFDAGNKFAVTEQAKAQYRNVVATYRQTVLSAFQDVEDNLVSLRLLSREIQQQDAAVSAARRYLNLANDRYRLGIDSYLNVIVAQTSLLNNERTAVTLRLTQLQSTVQLIKAVGGGWSGDLTKPEPQGGNAAQTARSAPTAN
jgi:NodT family efflux transporter outer membrane factor (OMF) lipoprotein